MSKKDDAKYLADIIEYGREALSLAATTNAEEFHRSRTSQLALTYLVQIVGEASYQLSDEMRAELPAIAWPKIIGMRHRLVHGYSEVAYDIVWRVVINDLPSLIAALEQFTPPEPPSA
ncbi:MAG TPA: HepT-like ribonuclease domain-containing protein [Thermoanaerobaculia bacterium]|jgi:uncharacterized protein with HEPN domain